MSRLPERLETPRLELRLPVPADAEALNAAIRASHAELTRWMDWAVTPQTLNQTREFVAEAARNWSQETAFNALLIERATGEIIGGCGYPRIDWPVPAFEIGYWCRTDRVGHGFVSEATAALARHAFGVLDARRVELRMDDRNTRSWRVAERLGFRHEGTIRNHTRTARGELRDSRIYGLVTLNELLEPGP